MKRVIMTLLIAGVLTSPVFAADRHLRLVGPQRSHACLFSAWVDDYCRFHTFDWFHPSDYAGFRACFIANGGYRCD